jgi:hypothetical protein
MGHQLVPLFDKPLRIEYKDINMIIDNIKVMNVSDEDFVGEGRDLGDLKNLSEARDASVIIYNGNIVLKNRGFNPMPRNAKRKIPAEEMPHVEVHTADAGPEGFAVMHSEEEIEKIMDSF